MISEFGQGDHNAYLSWVNNNPDGYIWNVGHRRLHHARCRIMRQGVPVADPKNPPKKKLRASKVSKKICASTKQELIEEVPTARDSTRYCSVCGP